MIKPTMPRVRLKREKRKPQKSKGREKRPFTFFFSIERGKRLTAHLYCPPGDDGAMSLQARVWEHVGEGMFGSRTNNRLKYSALGTYY